MRVLFVTCAEGSVIDRYTGALSLFNIMDKLTVLAFPLFIPRLVCVAVLERNPDEPNEGMGKIEVFVGNTTLMSQESPVTFSGQNRTSVVAILHGMPIMQPGTLHFRFSIGNAEGAYDIPMEKADSQQLELFTQLASARLAELTSVQTNRPEIQTQHTG
jgi:hypothetical protein